MSRFKHTPAKSKVAQKMRGRSMEAHALQHAKDELEYRKSGKAAKDLEKDKERRAKADKAVGHLPACSLSKCAPGCPSLKGKKK